MLLDVVVAKMRTRWEELLKVSKFTHSSLKTWATTNRFTGKSSKPKPYPLSANSIASALVKMENGKIKDQRLKLTELQ